MLPKKFRLQNYQEIEKIKKEGKLFQSPLFGLLLIKGFKRFSSRFAFIVSTKISKKSTERNRAKRFLSESVRLLLPKIKPGFISVLLAKKGLIGKDFNQIRSETERIFKERGLL